ncbi:MAG: hypothetical protein AADX96_19435 [Thiocapsa sp. C3-sup]
MRDSACCMTLYEFDGIAALKALPEQERTKLSGILDGKPTQDMRSQVDRDAARRCHVLKR